METFPHTPQTYLFQPFNPSSESPQRTEEYLKGLIEPEERRPSLLTRRSILSSVLAGAMIFLSGYFLCNIVKDWAHYHYLKERNRIEQQQEQPEQRTLPINQDIKVKLV